MFTSQRKLLSQNFLHNRRLVEGLVAKSSLSSKDTVLEIGPGKGIITEFLVQKVQTVVAVEIDPEWCDYLRTHITAKNFILYHADVLSHKFPKKLPYKVFANLPFSIESQIVRKLLEDVNPPTDSYLVVAAPFGARFFAKSKPSQAMILYSPWFEFSLEHRFKTTDFVPEPSITSVLLRILQKELPLLPFNQREEYWRFVNAAFKDGQPIYKNLVKRYGQQKVGEVFHKLSLSRKTKPSWLRVNQWITLFQQFQTQVPAERPPKARR